MTSTELPWKSAVQELALTRSRQEWAVGLEYVASQLAEAKRCRFFVPQEPDWVVAATGEVVSAPENTLVGQAWSLAESVSRSGSEPIELTAGQAAELPCWALPLRSFGRTVGLLTMEGVAHPPEEEAWDTMLGLFAHSWETVGKLEDYAAYSEQAEKLLTQALQSLPSQSHGHPARVSDTALELARILDLSAHQRQRLKRAGLYHDVGLLVSAVDHAKAGADFLRAGKVHADLASLVENHHARYDTGIDLSLEHWTLVLAEHFQEYCEASGRIALAPVAEDAAPTLGLGGDATRPAADSDAVQALVQRFAFEHGGVHHPDALDALVGLSVSGKLETLMPTE